MGRPTSGKWSWNMDEDGVATVYGGTAERPAAIADFWRKPLRLKRAAMARDAELKAEQIANVVLFCGAKQMLAALKVAAPVLYRQSSLSPEAARALHVVHAAIARATAEQA